MPAVGLVFGLTLRWGLWAGLWCVFLALVGIKFLLIGGVMSGTKFDYVLTFDDGDSVVMERGRCTLKQYRAMLAGAPVGAVGNLKVVSGTYKSVLVHERETTGVVHIATWT